MSQYRDAVIARLNSTPAPEVDELDELSPGIIREPDGGLSPGTPLPLSTAELVRRARRGSYTIGL